MRTPTLLAVTLALSTLPAQAKDPSLGATTFTVYEAYMSPAQEPGEESEIPKALEKSLGATAPSVPRESRKSKGYGRIRFAKDLSKAYVDVEIQGVNASDILMFHIHCGPPGVLGPIIVDFGDHGSLAKQLAEGRFSMELTNKSTWRGRACSISTSTPRGTPITEICAVRSTPPRSREPQRPVLSSRFWERRNASAKPRTRS